MSSELTSGAAPGATELGGGGRAGGGGGGGGRGGEAAGGSAGSPVRPERPERPRNRIQVSREKRPLSFFISLAKKFLRNEDEVELSGLGLAVTTVVTIAEILKNSGHVQITKISTSLVDMKEEGRTNNLPKAKIQIWIKKSDRFMELIAQEEGSRRKPAGKSDPSSQDGSRTAQSSSSSSSAVPDKEVPSTSTKA